MYLSFNHKFKYTTWSIESEIGCKVNITFESPDSAYIINIWRSHYGALREAQFCRFMWWLVLDPDINKGILDNFPSISRAILTGSFSFNR